MWEDERGSPGWLEIEASHSKELRLRLRRARNARLLASKVASRGHANRFCLRGVRMKPAGLVFVQSLLTELPSTQYILELLLEAYMLFD